MKKASVILASVFVLMLTACVAKETSLPDVVTMENIDEVLFAENVQLVDVRDWDEKMSSGYIMGFEMLPFYDYFEAEGHIYREDGDLVFSPEDIVNPAYIKNFFNKDARAIYITCSSRARSTYMVEVLHHLGYENVYEVGSVPQYRGDYKINGDGQYTFPQVEE